MDHRQALITTYSGRVIDPFNPNPKDIVLSDIAQALSMQCRFCGHVGRFISVAQHCVLVSELCETPEGKKWGLLHDASEAYISDIPRPLKKNLPTFNDVEEYLFKAIAEKFKLEYPMPEEVKFYDTVSLFREGRDFMPGGSPIKRPEGIEVPEGRLPSWSPQEARERFRERYFELFTRTGK